MLTPPLPSPDAIDIVSLGRAVRRSLPSLLLIAIAAGTLSYGLFSTMVPRYAAEAQLAIVAKTTNPFPDQRDRAGGADPITPRLDKEAINTHVRALLAPDLLLGVAAELDLGERVEFNSALGDIDGFSGALRVLGLGGPRAGENDQDRVLAALYRQLEVSAARESRFIPIRFLSADPQLAADFANKLAEAYRARLVAMPVEETGLVVSVLAPKVAQLEHDLIETEAEVERYRASTDQFRGGAQSTPLTDQRMAALADELTRAQAQRSDAEARWRTARDITRTGTAELVPDVQKSPLMQGLIAQRVRLERQISEAGATLLPAHPRMQQLNADLAGLKRQVAGEVQNIVQGLEKDYLATALRADTVAADIEALKSKVVSGSGNEARLRALEASAKAKRAELERLQKQLEDNKTVLNTRQVPIEAQIISRARASSVPAFPKKGPYALLAMAATMLIGMAYLITREMLLRSHGLFEAARQWDAPLETKSVSAIANAAAAPATGIEEPDEGRLAVVADRLLARKDMAHAARTIVASSTAKLDPRPEALALARTLARAGKQVVLVGWSLSGEQLIDHIGAQPRPGFIQLVEGSAIFEDAVLRLPGSDAHVIDAGSRPIHRASVLDPDRLNMILDALDAAYDHVIVTGAHHDLQVLFEAVEGRFDAAVSLLDGESEPLAAGAEPIEHFLGFEVTGIEIINLGQGSSPPAAAPHALAANA